MMNEPTQELNLEIKKLILETLGITDVDIDRIDDEKPLFGGENELTLDSVDALEIIMALQRKYEIRIADQAQARYTIRSINSIAEFIKEQKNLN
jgi:acyl carrier protein